MSEKITKPCASCGKPIRGLEIPDGSFGGFLRAVPVTCDVCTERDREVEAAHAHNRAEAKARVRASERFERSGIPMRYRDVLGRVDRSGARATVVERVEAWATRQNGDFPGLVLFGSVGVGKTYLAAYAARLLIEGGLPLKWVSWPVLMVQALANLDSDERAEANRALSTSALPLVIDDVDKVRSTEWAGVQLFTALDSRYGEKTPFILTMNCQPGELAARFGGAVGSAIASRAAEVATVIDVPGSDRRSLS